jgi:hypothetical protein
MNEQTQVEQPVAPDLEALSKELDEWCKSRGVVIVPVAVGRKTGQLANIADWEPESHVFSHALARSQQ